jgi:hypothetical protein
VRIEGVRIAASGERPRLSARIVWETARRAPEDAWFETDPAHADGLVARPEAFLPAFVLFAMERGERRIVVEGALCPTLLRGMAAAMRTWTAWYPGLVPLEIEVAGGLAPRTRPADAVTATTLAGGVDSLFAIRANRLDLPLDHPHAVRDVFFVLGMNTNDFAGPLPDPERARNFETRLARWGPLAAEARVRVVPVASNVRTFALRFRTWARGGIGAFLAGLAHAFSGRVGRLLVPTSGGTDPIQPDSCHPMLVPFFSSTAVDLVLDGQAETRIGKTRLVADWPAALAILQPCQQHEIEPDAINCGRCNKCARTMVVLRAIGRLDAATSFPRLPVDVAFVRGMHVANEFDVSCHRESAALLRASGEADLAQALERRAAAWVRRRKLRALRGRLLGRVAPAGEQA